MASIRKRGDKYYAEVRKKGKRFSKSFNKQSEAKRWAAEIELEIIDPLNGKIFSDLLIRYRDEVTPRKKSYKSETLRINKILKHKIANVMLKDLTTDDLVRYRDHLMLSVAANSVWREFSTIKAMFTTARKEWKWIKENPATDVQMPKKPQARDRRISQDAIDLILDALFYDDNELVKVMRQEIAIAFLFALETAMRQGEIWELSWDRIFLDKKYLTLEDTKNGTRRNVPLSSRAIELLRKLKASERPRPFMSNQDSAGQAFRRAIQIAGLKNLHFHDTRHEAITRLAQKLDVLDLARMVGHNDPRSLMVYYNATATEIADRLD